MQVLRVVLAAVAAFLGSYVAYLAVFLAWFSIEGANLKIGPADLATPTLIFHLGTTAIAAIVAAVLAARILTGRWLGSSLILAGTVAITALGVAVQIFVVGVEPDQAPYVPLSTATVAALFLSVFVGRRTDRRAPPES